MPMSVVEQYYQMIEHLDNQSKIELISKIQADVHANQQSQPYFGAWDDNKDADEIIAQIKEHSSISSTIESFS